jgi:hypothetical protein
MAKAVQAGSGRQVFFGYFLRRLAKSDKRKSIFISKSFYYEHKLDGYTLRGMAT